MPKRNIVWVAIAAVIAAMLWKLPETILEQDALYHNFSPLLVVREQIIKNYVEEPDNEEMVESAIRGVMHDLDPFCEYYPPEEVRRFETTTEGQFEGIGVEVRKADNGEVLIICPIEGSPALKAGLRPGDRISAVEGEPTAGRELEDVIRQISGPPGTAVELTIHRPQNGDTLKTFDVSIQRAEITVRSVRGWERNSAWEWNYLLDPETGIAYLRITAFENQTTAQLEGVIDDLLQRNKLRGLILDLRDNGGGLLETVTRMADLFLTEGVIVSTRGRSVPMKAYNAGSAGTFPDFPMVVLVNGRSASASEILSGALRDHHRAVLVGERTYGKGSVQATFPVPMPDGREGRIKLTTSYYYLPNGDCIHKNGIEPDVVVELTEEQRNAMYRALNAVYHPAAAATQPAPATAPGDGEHVRIMIDPQLEKAIQVLREKLAARAA